MTVNESTYTIDEVAALLGVSRNNAYLAAREDRLPIPVIKIGKRMMVSRSALDRLLASNGHDAGALAAWMKSIDARLAKLEAQMQRLRDALNDALRP